MRATWLLAINSLAGRRLRTGLLVAAIAAAVALMMAVASVLATIDYSHQQSVGKLFGLAQLRVVHRYHQRLPISVAHTIGQWPEVKHVAVSFENTFSLKHVATDQKRKEYRFTLQSVGIEPEAYQQLRPMSLLKGRMIEKPGEVVLDETAAEKLHADLGSQLEVIRFGDPITLTLVGVASRPKLGVLQQSQGLIVLEEAQRLGGLAELVDQIEIQLYDDQDAQAVVDAHENELPATAMLQTTAGATAGVTRGLAAARMMLNLTTLLVYIAAGFIIAASLTTAVAEQLRELAILRCVGARRLQVACSQLLAGAILTTGGTLIGVPLGMMMAYGLFHHYQSILPGGYDPAWTSAFMAIAASFAAGLASAAYPAIVASRVSPVVGLAARAWKPSYRGIVWCLIAGLVMVTLPLLVFLLPLDSQTLFWFFPIVGMPMILTGYFLLSVPLGVVVTTLLAKPVGMLFRLPNTLLRQTVATNPFRNGFTAAALMVSLALLINIWMGGRSFLSGWFDQIQIPDAFVHSAAPIPKAQQLAIQALACVTDTSVITAFPVPSKDVQFGVKAYAPTSTLFVASDVPSFVRMADLKWVQGDIATAVPRMEQGGAVVVSQEFLTVHKIGKGDQITLGTQFGPKAFEIVGVVASPGLDIAVQFYGIQRAYIDASVGSVFGTNADARHYWGVDAANLMLLSLDSKVSDASAIAQITAAAPGVTLGSSRSIRNMVHALANGLMRIASVIAMVGLAIACLGVGNLIMASIQARAFEFGVIRSIGGSRPVLVRLIAGQTLLTAIAGCMLGFALGIEVTIVGQHIHRRLVGLVYGLNIPWDVTLWGTIAVIAAALLAALPATVFLLRTHPRELLASE